MYHHSLLAGRHALGQAHGLVNVGFMKGFVGRTTLRFGWLSVPTFHLPRVGSEAASPTLFRFVKVKSSTQHAY